MAPVVGTGQFEIIAHGNPELRINEIFPAHEDLRSPRFMALRDRFAIDAVVAGVDGEFDRILALRHWVSSTIAIDNDHPTEVLHQEAICILDAASRGGRFHCAHHSLVLDAVLNAYGHLTRRLGVGPGTIEDGRHHGTNEVWVNELCQWVVVDAKYDLHFEVDGKPLSALQIRDAVWRDGGGAVRLVYGPMRQPGPQRGSESAAFYRWLSWEPDTSRFSRFPSCGISSLIVLEDEHFLAGTWLRDGRPHWAYEAGFFIRVRHRDWIEWTPQVIACDAGVETGHLRLRFSSCTPNFAAYQISIDGGAWTVCPDVLSLVPPAVGCAIRARAVNLAGVAGPVHALAVRPLHALPATPPRQAAG